jgi:hypothetical protein
MVINGSEMIFMLFQTEDMQEEKYADDIKLVEHDLKNLKSILEEIIGHSI